ncbi:methyl-accepting chemotaxis protein [Aminithiophilus ramosus]|uniref:Methyl-accepting chemotaxis protein n=2 Tax=Synergistales TaxID=649776 RepID=A0A9Q7EVQ5_9BACT|nr:methyl-accepting chemotaxis protein [Aminithiophilus ramosus]QTX32169.1 methyl-accepting chemotaxis protein [Aminithiophilus ramosus]QVL36036.1 methyl-accepting chemotaxis protein [Synergistota bacterium]
MTIRGKLIGMAVVVLAVIAVMAATTYYRGGTIVRGLVNTAGSEVVRTSAENIDGQFDRIEAMVLVAAESVRHAMTRLDLSDRAAVEDLVVALTEGAREKGIGSFRVGLAGTGELADGARWKAPEGYDARTRPWYASALAAGRGVVVFSEPFEEQINHTMNISVSTAVYDDGGKPLAVVVADMNVGAMSEAIAGLKVFGKGSGLLVLPSGVLVAYHDREKVLKANILKDPSFPEPLRKIGERMTAGASGFDTYTYEGEERQMFYVPTRRGYSLGILFPVSEITAMVHGLTTILLLVAALALVVTASIVAVVVRGLSRGIASMKAATEKLGEGDLTLKREDFAASSRDELGQMADALARMVAAQRETIAAVLGEADRNGQTAQSLAALAEEANASVSEIKHVVGQVADLAQSNAAALEEANASIEEVASSATSAAQSSTEGAEASHVTRAATEEAVSVVDSVITDVVKVGQISAASLKDMEALVRSVSAIAGFVTTISAIADQTNLLALNAAIEAARAGEAGRGFAVVAEEVRKLAEESNQAAREIGGLIDSLKVSADASTAGARQTGERMTETAEKAQQARDKLNRALADVERINDLMQTIAAAAQEQAASSEEMASAVDQVSKSTVEMAESSQTIRHSTEELAHAGSGVGRESQSMAEGAERMRDLLRRFRIDDGAGLLPVGRRS